MRVDNISRIKKERFLKSLSEDAFRDLVVRPLFLRLGLEDGRDLCGPQEAGKDAIFAETDNLGFTVITAVQTKKGNLNLASKAHANLISAITQLRTALNTTVVLLKPKRKVKPNRVILCASGTINEQARKHVVDDVGNPNIQFLDSDELIPLIDENLPEFWLGIDADIQPYFRAIEAMVVGVSAGSASASGPVDILSGGATDDGFVSLKLYKPIVRKKKVHGVVHEVPDIVEVPLGSVAKEKSGKTLILGDAGSGKTTGLLRLAYEMARDGLQDAQGYRIPILVRAIELVRQAPSDIVSYMDTFTREITRSSKSCFTLNDLRDGRVVLFVDSLDEVGSNDGRREVLRLIKEFSEHYPECKIVLSSRPYRFVQELAELREYDEFRISPISWRQAEKIFVRAQKGKALAASSSKEVLRKLERIHGIELNPLLVTVFAASSDFSKQDIPANITELFKKFTELLLGRWDERKGLKHQYQAPLKDFVVTKIAFHMHLNKLTAMLRSDLEGIVDEELKLRGYGAEGPELLSEILERSGLFKLIGEQVEFRHHLLQEFFAGRGIAASDFVMTVIHDEWWKRALVFYFGDNPARVDLLKSAMSSLSDVALPDLYEAATTVGLANQACYLSTVDEKLDVWRWVVHALCRARDATLATIDPYGRIPLTNYMGYYLYARDSVALSHLRSNVKELQEWCQITGAKAADREAAGKAAVEEPMFWLITGLVESGDIDAAGEVLLKYNSSDPRLLVAIHLGCYLAAHVRPIEPSQKGVAIEICKRFERKIAPYRKQLLSEWGSELIELRNGDIAAADDDKEPVNLLPAPGKSEERTPVTRKRR